MRKLFHGYYRPSTKEFEFLWTSAILVLDANVILNVYRYSQGTRKALLDLLQKYKDRLWMPYQFAVEYHRRRLDVISGQAKGCSNTKKSLQDILESFKSQRAHALVSEKLLKSISKVCDVLEKSMVEFEQLLINDVYLETITNLLEHRIGEPPDPEKLAKWQTEAAERFKNKIPPGYEDDGPKSGPNAYGDYVGWAQIIEHAKAKSCSVILVTDDRKSDWWIEKRRGKSIGPRPELIEEFHRITNQQFYMYTPSGFIEIAASRASFELPKSAIQEVLDESISSPTFEKDSAPVEKSIDSPKMYIPPNSESPEEKAVRVDENEVEKDPPKRDSSKPEGGEY
jgi:hypothetical protein